jgi:hypothetical protein
MHLIKRQSGKTYLIARFEQVVEIPFCFFDQHIRFQLYGIKKNSRRTAHTWQRYENVEGSTKLA